MPRTHPPSAERSKSSAINWKKSVSPSTSRATFTSAARASTAAPGILLYLADQTSDITLLYRNVYNGMDSFPLMAIPFFMLAGEMMNRGGITIRLVEFSQALMGHLRGGLAHVNVLSSILFAGLSGSAVADTSALGSMLIPAMEKQGYTRRFAAAITAVFGPVAAMRPAMSVLAVAAMAVRVVPAAVPVAVSAGSRGRVPMKPVDMRSSFSRSKRTRCRPAAARRSSGTRPTNRARA